jgi:3-dehydrotetronate 4-kinase
MLLGCIGDDFTGSSDLGNTLTRQGMRCAQYVGVPDGPADPGVEAGIVALKSRSIPAPRRWRCRSPRSTGCGRRAAGSSCSSTARPSIPPMPATSAPWPRRWPMPWARRGCWSAPPSRRRADGLQGHLFVGDRLLSESGMQHHPLTPMTDPDLRRVLARQATGPVDHLPLAGPCAPARSRRWPPPAPGSSWPMPWRTRT